MTTAIETSETEGAPTPKHRLVLGIDPADRAGLATWDTARPRDGLIEAIALSIDRAGFTQLDAIAVVQVLLGGAEWFAVVERPTPRGGGAPPTHAERFWRDVIKLVARDRAKDRGLRYRIPTVLRPMASQWRGPLGIRTRAITRGSHDERRAELKEAAIARLARMVGRRIEDPDAAEAACQAAWGAGCLTMGKALVGNKVTAIRWVA